MGECEKYTRRQLIQKNEPISSIKMACSEIGENVLQISILIP